MTKKSMEVNAHMVYGPAINVQGAVSMRDNVFDGGLSHRQMQMGTPAV